MLYKSQEILIIEINLSKIIQLYFLDKTNKQHNSITCVHDLNSVYSSDNISPM